MSIWRSLPSPIAKDASACTSISPISACSATWSRPAASRTAPSAPIWRSPPPRPASATWSRRSARRCWCAARQGVTPTQAGRTLLQHARTILRQAERLREDLGAYAGGLAGQIRVLSNTNALTEFLPEALSSFLAAHPQCQRRSRGAAERRDRRPDRRGRRRHRHRRRHRRCERARDLSVPQRPVRAGGGARPSAGQARQDRLRAGARPRFRRPRPRQRPAALPRRARRRRSGGRCGCACSCAASTRCAGWSSAMSASASCRRPRRAAAAKTMAITVVALTDPWALRDLTICIRGFERAAALCAPAGRAFAIERLKVPAG